MPRFLLVVNRSSGTGHGKRLADRLAKELSRGYGGDLAVEVAVVDSHPKARSETERFVRAHRQAVVVAAGGGGTLRAVVEGVMDTHPRKPPAAARVRLGALRMGSGNVVAKNLGIALDPLAGARQAGEALAAGRTSECGVMRCSFGTASGGTDIRHAVTMCGLGEWGRVPGDIERHRSRHAVARSRAARVIGLERVNQLEYLGAGSLRLLQGATDPSRCELVEVKDVGPMRMLAAVALNMPLPPLPDPRVEMEEAAIGLLVVPRFGRPFRRRLDLGDRFEMKLLDRDHVEFFLDEDPELAYGWLRLEAVGTLSMLPGNG